MRVLGCLLLISGWLIVIAALVMLSSQAARTTFIVSGLTVEALGFVLLAIGQRIAQRSHE
jgi:hypothetical protein